jgi:predicted TIM-barrel fold metal-dependent hydrolase
MIEEFAVPLWVRLMARMTGRHLRRATGWSRRPASLDPHPDAALGDAAPADAAAVNAVALSGRADDVVPDGGAAGDLGPADLAPPAPPTLAAAAPASPPQCLSGFGTFDLSAAGGASPEGPGPSAAAPGGRLTHSLLAAARAMDARTRSLVAASVPAETLSSSAATVSTWATPDSTAEPEVGRPSVTREPETASASATIPAPDKITPPVTVATLAAPAVAATATSAGEAEVAAELEVAAEPAGATDLAGADDVAAVGPSAPDVATPPRPADDLGADAEFAVPAAADAEPIAESPVDGRAAGPTDGVGQAVPDAPTIAAFRPADPPALPPIDEVGDMAAPEIDVVMDVAGEADLAPTAVPEAGVADAGVAEAGVREAEAPEVAVPEVDGHEADVPPLDDVGTGFADPPATEAPPEQFAPGQVGAAPVEPGAAAVLAGSQHSQPYEDRHDQAEAARPESDAAGAAEAGLREAASRVVGPDEPLPVRVVADATDAVLPGPEAAVEAEERNAPPMAVDVDVRAAAAAVPASDAAIEPATDAVLAVAAADAPAGSIAEPPSTAEPALAPAQAERVDARPVAAEAVPAEPVTAEAVPAKSPSVAPAAAVAVAAPNAAAATAAKSAASTVLAPAVRDEFNRTNLDYRRPMPRPKVRGRVVDFHCHLFALRHAADWFEAADHYGMDVFLTMSPLEEAVGLAREWGHRLRFNAVPSWGDASSRWVDNWLDRIEAFYNLGSRIAKFHASPGTMVMRGVRLDHPAYRPIFAELKARRMGIMTHIGDPDTWYHDKYTDHAKFGTRDEHYRMWEDLLTEHRGTPWVGAHLGGNPEDLPRLQRLLDKFPDLMLDCSATRWMVREVSARRDAAREFFVRNQDRILFGSDQVSGHDRHFDFLASRIWCHRKLWETAYTGPSPIIDPDLPRDKQPVVRGLALPDVVLQKIYHDNATKLLDKLGMGFDA